MCIQESCSNKNERNERFLFIFGGTMFFHTQLYIWIGVQGIRQDDAIARGYSKNTFANLWFVAIAWNVLILDKTKQ